MIQDFQQVLTEAPSTPLSHLDVPAIRPELSQRPSFESPAGQGVYHLQQTAATVLPPSKRDIRSAMLVAKDNINNENGRKLYKTILSAVTPFLGDGDDDTLLDDDSDLLSTVDDTSDFLNRDGNSVDHYTMQETHLSTYREDLNFPAAVDGLSNRTDQASRDDNHPDSKNDTFGRSEYPPNSSDGLSYTTTERNTPTSAGIHHAPSLFSRSSTITAETSISDDMSYSNTSVSPAIVQPPLRESAQPKPYHPPLKTAQTFSQIRRKPIDNMKRQSSLPTGVLINAPEEAQDGSQIPPLFALSPSSLRSVESAQSSIIPSSNPDCVELSSISSETPGDIVAASSVEPCHMTSPVLIHQKTSQPRELIDPATCAEVDKPDEDGYPLIVTAARYGDENMVKAALASSAKIEAVHTTTQRTALIEAAVKGHGTVVAILLKHNCAVDHIDADSMSALHYAARNGDQNIIEQLLANSANINRNGPMNQTPLHLAMQESGWDTALLLLQHNARAGAQDKSLTTPLHISASKGHITLCSKLLDSGAQLGGKTASSKTPLYLAAEGGHLQVVQLFLDRGESNPKDESFRAAFFVAVEGGFIRIVDAFFDKGIKLKKLHDSWKPAILASKSGNLTMLDLMITKKCRLKDKEKDPSNGWTALHYAAYHGHITIMERLVAKDYSSKATTPKKETALHLAVKAGHYAAADFLLSKGVGVSAKDSHGQEALHLAVYNGDTEMVNLLLSKSAKIDTENSFAWRPLHIAIAYGHIQLLEVLLEKGASIEDGIGKTSYNKSQTQATVESGYWAEAQWPYPGSRPLHLAIEYGRPEIINLLFNKGAELESQCSEYWRPLHHAAFHGSVSTLEHLLENKVYVHAMTAEGKTALALDFRTSEPLIEDNDKARIRELLRTSMVTAPRSKKDQMKTALTFGGRKVEGKNELLKAAVVARREWAEKQNTGT